MWIEHGNEERFQPTQLGIGGFVEKAPIHKTQFELLGGKIAAKEVVAPLELSDSIREQLWLEAVENGNHEEAARLSSEANNI